MSFLVYRNFRRSPFLMLSSSCGYRNKLIFDGYFLRQKVLLSLFGGVSSLPNSFYWFFAQNSGDEILRKKANYLLKLCLKHHHM